MFGSLKKNEVRILYFYNDLNKKHKIEPGDLITKINGNKKFNLKNILDTNPKKITLEINNSKIIKILIEKKCDLNFYILTTLNKEIAFFRSNNNIFLSDGLLDYIKNDSELVMLLSNEFTHYVKGHKSLQVSLMNISKSASGTGGEMMSQLFGIYFSAVRYGSNFLQKLKFKYDRNKENFADFSSIQLTKILGYDANLAKKFWERLVKEKPQKSTISNFRSVDSQKIRTINYSLDFSLTSFPNKEEYDKFMTRDNN